MVAAHLLRAGGARVVLFDQTGRFGTGVAYSTTSSQHLLNVPAGRMSAFPDAADDFLRWGQRHGHVWTGGSFVPRMIYGQYLRDTLNAAESAGGMLLRVTGEVISARETPSEVKLEWRGEPGAAVQTTRADAAVLALGNFAPRAPHPSLRELDPARYMNDPWCGAALAPADPTSPLLLVGTGLTMVDVCLTLTEGGHRGPIHAVSRRGLLPTAHRAAPKPAKYEPPKGVENWERTARGYLREVRREVAAAAKRGVDWREVITSLRPVTQRLWQGLDLRERKRFNEHVRPFWEIVRHRSAPTIDGRIQELILSGRLVIHSGRILGATPVIDGVDVRMATRGSGGERTRRFSRVINCTGPNSDCRVRADAGADGLGGAPTALIAQLVREGLATADPLGLGLRADAEGRLERKSPGLAPRLWLIGPLRKADLWECTAVPELRDEAAKVAGAISRESAAWGLPDVSAAC
jgi:uncharacterized NAD(P)/FAD-binding protein YdhS